MASILPHGKGHRAHVVVNGRRASKVFKTKGQALAWAVQMEGELSGERLPVKTFSDALDRYGKEVSPQHKGHAWELIRLRAMGRSSLGNLLLSAITGADIATWRNDRLKSVAPATVLREMKLMRSVFESARRDFGWIKSNPMADVTRPVAPPSRKRRVSDDEIVRLRLSLGLASGYSAETDTQRVGLCFLLGLETAMRASEMLGLRWKDVDLADAVATLPRTKNGDAREVPLSPEAIRIIEAFPRGEPDDLIVGVSEKLRDALFRKCRDRAAIIDLHFHDSRAEGIWRLSKKLDVLQLARAIGHRDLKSLLIYYQEPAKEIAKKLA